MAKNGDLLDFFDEFFIHKNADKSAGGVDVGYLLDR